ncbi:MAG: TetR/AcrR family transcriptional regulator [Rhodobacter sp.]|nr:TetR/AcrR family transcriptional regulator [Rhodobacter sp.]
MPATADPRSARTPTRERILAVAQDAIIVKGFDATSVDEIAAAVEISRAGFFYHFHDKNALARALIERQIVEEGEMLNEITARASELLDDPLQQMLIMMRLMAERYVEVPGGYAGCILASATYQDRLFDAEVKAANRRAHLVWRERFRAHFDCIAVAHPPREAVDAGDMADMLNALIEGGMILARGMGDPQVLVRQVLLAQQLVKVLYSGP